MTEKTKQQLILEAAFQVFSDKGFYVAKVEEIAEKAGVGKGTIYEYFQSKAHLFHEMFKWHLERYLNEIKEGISEAQSSTEKIYLIVRNHISFGRNMKTLAGKLISESCPHDSKFEADFTQRMIKVHNNIIGDLQDIINQGIQNGEFREDIDVELVAIFLFGSLGGVIKSMVILDQNLEPDIVAQKVIDFLLKGMKK